MREWIILGTLLILYFGYDLGTNIDSKKGIVLSLPRYQMLRSPLAIFLLMIFFSLFGLLKPVRSIEGWMEAYRWFIFMIVYLYGKQYSKYEAKNKIVDRILHISLVCTLLAMIPGSEMIWPPPGLPEKGRFAATFGYPNAAAVFLGCQLLLLLKDRNIKSIHLLVFLISIISTGSRAAVVMLLGFAIIVISKKLCIKIREEKEIVADCVLRIYKEAVWAERMDAKKKTLWLKTFIFIAILIVLQQTILRSQDSFLHLLDWTDTSLAERITYYSDSIKLAWNANFLPRAGGWLAFPFVQTYSYWTLNPHSSLCQIMLNQGLPGVVILAAWSMKGIKSYCLDLYKSTDLTVICGKTVILYLGIHSLLDVDMSFGVLGIVFWFLVGMYSR